MKESFQKWVFLILFIILTVLLGKIMLSEKGVKGYINLKRKVQQIEVENRFLKAEKERLELEIQRLKSDQGYIEKIARELYDLLKNNEIVIKFADEDSNNRRQSR